MGEYFEQEFQGIDVYPKMSKSDLSNSWKITNAKDIFTEAL